LTRDTPPPDITDLLVQLREGDGDAMERLMPLVYDELRRRAHYQLARGGPDAALDTTGLVHEAWMRLARAPHPSFADRNHFYGVAVKAMRSVVIDYARRTHAQKRGGDARQVDLDDNLLRVEKDAAGILAVNQALERLAVTDGRLAHLVELRFFGGLSVDETAEVLGVSERTVKRDWTKARTLLYGFLQGA
jgi:RNA polymerase sigma factor (TIGR02999 family)